MAGSVVRLEPLGPRHTAGLFACLGQDDEAWRWMIVQSPQTPADMSAILDGYIEDRSIASEWPSVKDKLEALLK